MSVANTLIADNAVHVVTDGGWTDAATGRLIDISSKVFAYPEKRAAMVGLGGAWVGPCLDVDIRQQEYTNYSELRAGILARLPTTIREVHEQVAGAPPNWGLFAIVLAGWQDGKGRAEVLFVDNTNPKKAPIVTITDGAHWLGIPVPAGLDPDNIEESARVIVGAQRYHKEPVMPGGVAASVATGFVELTTIDANGIRSKIVGRFPDRVGEVAVV